MERRQNEAEVRTKRHGRVKGRNRWDGSGRRKGASEAQYNGRIMERDPRGNIQS
jgi:hypothetical protein